MEMTILVTCFVKCNRCRSVCQHTNRTRNIKLYNMNELYTSTLYRSFIRCGPTGFDSAELERNRVRFSTSNTTIQDIPNLQYVDDLNLIWNSINQNTNPKYRNGMTLATVSSLSRCSTSSQRFLADLL